MCVYVCTCMYVCMCMYICVCVHYDNEITILPPIAWCKHLTTKPTPKGTVCHYPDIIGEPISCYLNLFITLQESELLTSNLTTEHLRSSDIILSLDTLKTIATLHESLVHTPLYRIHPYTILLIIILRPNHQVEHSGQENISLVNLGPEISGGLPVASKILQKGLIYVIFYDRSGLQ